ncbi:MAG: hypothetical protein ACREM8_00090 [Vulcanimicrobiaceae bacterium]
MSVALPLVSTVIVNALIVTPFGQQTKPGNQLKTTSWVAAGVGTLAPPPQPTHAAATPTASSLRPIRGTIECSRRANPSALRRLP